MLKSYQLNLIEAWINIYHLVTLDFSPGTTALLTSHLSSFQRLASGCFDRLFDANRGKDVRCIHRVFAPPTEDRGLQDVRCIFTFKSVFMVILTYKFLAKRARILCRIEGQSFMSHNNISTLQHFNFIHSFAKNTRFSKNKKLRYEMHSGAEANLLILKYLDTNGCISDLRNDRDSLLVKCSQWKRSLEAAT
jgi:hypothetical protein